MHPAKVRCAIPVDLSHLIRVPTFQPIMERSIAKLSVDESA